MTINNAALTLETCSGILADIAIDAGPNIPLCDQELSCSDFWVGKVVKRIENSAVKSGRNKRSRGTGGNISGKGGGCGKQRVVLELKRGRSWVCAKLHEFNVLELCRGHSIKFDG